MLCRSLAVHGLDKIKSLIEGAEMAEIRIERSGLNANEVKSLFASHPNLLATCRPEGLTDIERTELLKAAVDGGAKWIDIEVESEEPFANEMVKYAKIKGCKVIISYHNYDNTPSTQELEAIVADCTAKGAELVKLATMVNKTSDVARLINLYALDIPVLSLGMGKAGSITRLAALKLGAPFTFVSCDSEAETAPGQINESTMKSILSYL